MTTTYRHLAQRIDIVVMADAYFAMQLRFSTGGVPVVLTGTFEALTDYDSTLAVDDANASIGILTVSGFCGPKASRWRLNMIADDLSLTPLTSGKVTALEWLP